MYKRQVQHQAVSAYLASASGEFDLVFIDPPYEVSNEEVEANLDALSAVLAKAAAVVVERSSRGEKLKLGAGYELEEIKNYGDTDVYWLSAK